MSFNFISLILSFQLPVNPMNVTCRL